MSRQKRRNPSLAKVERVEHFQSVNFWAMVQNVAMHAVDKGQLLPLGLIAAVLLLIFRAPPEYSGQVLARVVSNLSALRGFAYLFCIMLPVGWFYHVRWYRRSVSAEMDRIGREKTRLQEELTRSTLSHPTRK